MAMTRPITLFTGQWADLPFEEVCRLASEWGYDGLEIACWGDHFEVDKALADDAYVAAGTTVTKDVPAGALALSRTPVKSVEGWVERFRARRRRGR